MIVYKYKSLGGDNAAQESEKLKYIIEILEEGKLFCAPYQKLNDPMEGYFDAVISDPSIHSAFADMVRRVNSMKNQYRICSLSTNNKSHLMWAHYANGFRGVAIAVEIHKVVNSIEEVEYSDGRNLGDYDVGGDIDALTQKVLLTKYKEWRYEKEIRIIKKVHEDSNCYHSLTKPPTAVYFGVNIQDAARSAIVDVCAKKGISAFDMSLQGYKINFKPTKMETGQGILPFHNAHKKSNR